MSNLCETNRDRRFPYGFVHFCFVIPRQFGLLKRLLTRATPAQLLFAKYASAFSMALFIVNIPGLMLRDLDFLVGHPTLSTTFKICQSASR